MNKELMLRVADAIEAEPKRYDQGVWIEALDENGDSMFAPWNEEPCNTAACIVGHGALLSGYEWKEIEAMRFSTRAELFGLDQEQAERLFNPAAFNWPDPYSDDFYEARNNGDKEEMARIAASMLRAIVAGEVKL